MSLTLKHFVFLARKLAEENATDHLVSGIADFCERQNFRFNREKFKAVVETYRSKRQK